MTITKAQRKAIKKIYDRRDPSTAHLSYRTFRKNVVHGYDCLMVQWAGMWLGIESDGYTHS